MGKAHQQQKWVFWVLVIFNKIAEEPFLWFFVNLVERVEKSKKTYKTLVCTACSASIRL